MIYEFVCTGFQDEKSSHESAAIEEDAVPVEHFCVDDVLGMYDVRIDEDDPEFLKVD